MPAVLDEVTVLSVCTPAVPCWPQHLLWLQRWWWQHGTSVGGRVPRPPCSPPPTDGHVFQGDLCCAVASSSSRWVGKDGTKCNYRPEVQAVVPVPHCPGAAFLQGFIGKGARQHPRSQVWAEAALHQGWLQLCQAMALLLAEPTLEVSYGKAQKKRAGKSVSISALASRCSPQANPSSQQRHPAGAQRKEQASFPLVL